MAAPTATTRLSPTGVRMDTGFRTKIACTDDANIEFWEKIVQPPGYDGGDLIPTSTMHNVEFRTFFPKSLITLTESVITAAYDPIVYTSIRAILHHNLSWTVTFPDGTTLAFWAAMTKAIPQPMGVEEEQPEIEITIVPTNYDALNCVEAGPVLVSVGTCGAVAA